MLDRRHPVVYVSCGTNHIKILMQQLFAVTIDLTDSIVTICRLVGHGARLDYIIAAGVALLLSDLGTLLEQEFDLLLKTVGVSPDLSPAPRPGNPAAV